MTARGAWATDTALLRLRAWWADPAISTSEIGRRLGTSKNSIIGKAHRLELDSRPSPIIHRETNWTEDKLRQMRALRRDPDNSWSDIANALGMSRGAVKAKTRALEPRPDAPTLAPLASMGPLAAVNRPAWAPPPKRIAGRPVFTAPVRPIPAPFVPRLRTEPCCWVTTVGGKGKPWLYCDAQSEPGKPYCEAHSRLAYVPVRHREPVHAMGGD